MVKLSRSFSSTEYPEGTELDEFQSVEPSARNHTVVHVDKSKNKLRVIDHTYPVNMDRDWSNRTWDIDIQFEDWESVLELIQILQRFQELPEDVTLEMMSDPTYVETSISEFYTDSESVYKSYTYEDIEVSFRISSCIIGLALIPEPDDPDGIMFPEIPVGRSFAREGVVSDSTNLKRLLELLKEAERGLEQEESTEPILTQDHYAKLSSTDYGHEVIHHAEDGDTCVESGLLHLALSSYIHAIEWTAICYLKEQGIDIIQKEQEGDFYNFAGGRNSILDELREHSNIDQKTATQLESMNRAERRWMAHHKSGDVLPEEVEAIRARLRSLIRDLFLTGGE